MARIAVVFTGGTISMAYDSGAGGLAPALSGDDIIARTPGLDDVADVISIDLHRLPASHFTLSQLLSIHEVIADLQADPAIDGVVVVQGTDTMEESSFVWDLVNNGVKPVVVTGAMEGSDSPRFDGPANLRDACIAAGSRQLQGAGVLVCLNGSVEPADDVVKMHSTALDAFCSPNTGPLARIADGVLTLLRPRPRRRFLQTTSAAEPVHLITIAIGVGGALIDAAINDDAQGIVVAATGSGNTHPLVLDAAIRAMTAGIPVALATRCVAGRAEPRYAFPGGGARWLEAGAIPVGHLSALKARVAIALGRGAGMGSSELFVLLQDPPP